MTTSPSSLSGNGGGDNAKTKNNSVRFGPQLRVDIHEVEMVEDLAAMWWTQAEIQEGRKEYEAVLFLMETGKEVNEEEHSARGLEKKTEDGAWALYENQRDAANAVLGEQDTLRRQRVKADCVQQTIAEACLEATAQSREAALAMGAKDYAQIKDYLLGISHSPVPASPKVRVRRKMTHTISPPGSPTENKWGRRISMPLMLPIGSPENKKMAKAAALALARQQVSTKKLKVVHPSSSSSALTDEDDLSSSENDDQLLFKEKKKPIRKESGEKKVKKTKKKSKAAASEDKPKKQKSASTGKTSSAATTVDKTTGETISAKATTATSAVGEAELQQIKDEIETLEKKIALKQARKAKATALKMISPPDSPKKKTKKKAKKKDEASPSSPTKKTKKKSGLTRSSSSTNMEKKLARLSKNPGASSFRKSSSILSTASTEPNDSEPNDSEDDDVDCLSSYLKTTTTAHNQHPIATTPTTQRPRLFLSRVIGSFRRKGHNDTNGYGFEDLNGSLSVCDYDEDDDASLADHSVSAESCCF